MTKTEIRKAIAEIDGELAALEKTHGEAMDMRPWVSNDHPVSLQHWALLQRRLRLKEELKKPSLTPERRAAVAKQLKAAREMRYARAGERSGLSQIAF